MDELFISSIVGAHPDYHVFYPFLSSNLSFASPMPVTSLNMPTNNGPLLRNFTFVIFKLPHWVFQRIVSFTVWFNITLMYSSLFQTLITAAHLSLNAPDHVALKTSPQ